MIQNEWVGPILSEIGCLLSGLKSIRIKNLWSEVLKKERVYLAVLTNGGQFLFLCDFRPNYSAKECEFCQSF